MNKTMMTALAAAACTALGASAQTAAPQDGVFGPANTVPGQCDAKALTPARFDTLSERVVSVAASQGLPVDACLNLETVKALGVSIN